MKRLRFLATFLIIIFVMSSPVICYSQQLAPGARAAALIDVASGRILYQKNIQERLPMASTTKIMTAIVAIEDGVLEDMVTASLRAQNTHGSSIYLQAGERLTLRELLYGLMLQSGNDAAVAIAEHVGTGLDNFVHRMNSKAIGIGAFNTNFANPHGLDAKGHYTTAGDLAKIASYALKNAEFARVVSTRQKKIPWWGRNYSRVLNNKNKILWHVEGGDGVKTGFTNNAGRCLVASATREGWQLVSVVLNCGSMWEDSKALLEYGFEAYEPVIYFKEGQFVGTITVKGSKKTEVGLLTEGVLRVPLTEEEKERVVLVEDLDDFFIAPVVKGQIAGSVKAMLDGETVARVNLVCAEDVPERSIKVLIPEIFKSIFK